MFKNKKKKEIPANLAESGISSVKHLEHIRQLMLKYTLAAQWSLYHDRSNERIHFETDSGYLCLHKVVDLRILEACNSRRFDGLTQPVIVDHKSFFINSDGGN